MKGQYNMEDMKDMKDQQWIMLLIIVLDVKGYYP